MNMPYCIGCVSRFIILLPLCQTQRDRGPSTNTEQAETEAANVD
jgi:hypothetical protein